VLLELFEFASMAVDERFLGPCGGLNMSGPMAKLTGKAVGKPNRQQEIHENNNDWIIRITTIGSYCMANACSVAGGSAAQVRHDLV
jgi:hypothetical protein